MGRSPCCDKARVKRGPWSREEDAILRSFVQRFANAGNWITLPQKAGLRRCGKSCRLRWLNYLRPALRHGGFTDEEDSIILSLYGEIGSRWSVIAAKLRGRTDNDVKNYWNTKLKKKYSLITTPSSTPPTGGDSLDTDSPSGVDQPPLEVQAPPPPALVNLDTALTTVEDGGDLTHESEKLYAELMGLIEQQSAANTCSSTGGKATSPSPPLETSPAASSSAAGSCTAWPVDVHDTTPLPEVELDGTRGAHAFAAVGCWLDSFQDLLASSYDEVIVTQQQFWCGRIG